VFLPNRDGHGAWVNSAALRLAGVSRDTPDPPDGRIERDTDGEPSGTLHEGAMDLVERRVPPATPAEWEAGLLEGQRYLHSVGITAWQDAWVTPEHLEVYLRLANDRRLTARVAGALWWSRDRGLDQIADLVEQRARGAAGRLRCNTVKVMQDGVPENFTAAMLQPYLGDQPPGAHPTGLSFVEPAALREAVTRLDAEGFQVHFHAIGDRAVRECLDAIEAARTANGARDARHHIAHLQWSIPTTSRGSPRSTSSRTSRRTGRASTTRCATCACPSSGRNGRRRSTPSACSSTPGRGLPWAATGR
jgi:predicted amidohydrolase YtcJ